MAEKSSRRTVIKKIVAGAAIVGGGGGAATLLLSHKKPHKMNKLQLKGNINHSVCRWCYGDIKLDDLCEAVKQIGFNAIDLIPPEDWGTLKKHGVNVAMCAGAEISLTEGWNHTEYHSKLIDNYTKYLPLMTTAGYKNLICFSGNRAGMD